MIIKHPDGRTESTMGGCAEIVINFGGGILIGCCIALGNKPPLWFFVVYSIICFIGAIYSGFSYEDGNKRKWSLSKFWINLNHFFFMMSFVVLIIMMIVNSIF